MEDETEEIFKAAQRMNRMPTKKVESTDGKGVVSSALRICAARSVDPNAESSDDEDVLSSLWGKRALNIDGRDEDDQVAKKPRRNTPQSHPKQPKDKAEAASSPSSGVAGRKLHNELDTSEQVVLSCEQLARALADSSQYLSVTVKQFNNVKSKVAARLSADLMATYSQQQEGVEEPSRGMLILDKLRGAQRRLDAAEDLIASLHATQGEEATAAFLHAAVAKAAMGGLVVTQKFQEMVALRAFGAHVGAEEWDSCRSVLLPAKDPEQQEPAGQFGLSSLGLPKDRVTDLQARLVTKAFSDLATSLKPLMLCAPTLRAVGCFCLRVGCELALQRQAASRLCGERISERAFCNAGQQVSRVVACAVCGMRSGAN